MIEAVIEPVIDIEINLKVVTHQKEQMGYPAYSQITVTTYSFEHAM